MKTFDGGHSDPDFQRHYARVLLAQARIFRLRRNDPGWVHRLLTAAGQARRNAQRLSPRDLFGSAA